MTADNHPSIDKAFDRYAHVQLTRVRSLFNRHRAVFAEFVVEQYLTGSTIVDDPTASWDLVWRVGGKPIRVQVKCSGSYLPRTRRHGTTAKWVVRESKSGWDPDTRKVLPPGLHCDLIVLARHVGDDVTTGWSFAAILPSQLPPSGVVTDPGTMVPPEKLAAAAKRALKAGST